MKLLGKETSASQFIKIKREQHHQLEFVTTIVL